MYDDDIMPILLEKTSEVHGLITINYKHFESILKIEEGEIFNYELETISGKKYLNVDETVVPRIMPNRRIQSQ